MIVETKDLNVAYQAYKDGKLMRQDLFRIVIDNVLALKEAVTELQAGKVETAAARTELAAVREQLAGLDAKIESKVATAVNATVSMVQAMQGYGPAPDNRPPITDKHPIKMPTRRGKPPVEATGAL